MTPERRERVRCIHNALRQQRRRGRAVTARSLVTELNNQLARQWSEKTVRRDLHFMRDSIHLPVEFVPRDNTFRYWQDVELVDITTSLLSSLEVFALLVGRQSLSQYEGTPWHDSLHRTYKQLIDAMPESFVGEYLAMVDKMRFEGPQVQRIANQVWSTVLSSLESEQSIDLTYKSGTDGRVQQRRVDPYGLVIIDRQWQLIAWDHKTKAVRTFLLTRIKDAQDTDKQFRVRDGFNLDQYLDGSVAGQQSTGRPVKVKLRFTVEGTFAGESQVWHRHERRSNDRQGRLIVEFETAALFKVEREVLGWGGRCEVLKPSSLGRVIQQRARSLQAIHAAKGPKKRAAKHAK